MINKDNYKEYIDRFLSAETSLAEENELYAWFSSPDVPPEAEKWRDMFGWYDSLGATDKAVEDHGRPRFANIIRWCSLAAGVALLITLGVMVARNTVYPDINPDYLAYEGSYIIRDGKKITDLSVVVPAILESEKEIQRCLDMIDDRLDEFDFEVESRLEINDYDILDNHDYVN